MAKLTEQDRTPPKSAQSAAKKVLEWKEKHGDEVKGMTQTGWTRARQIASGEPLSLDTIKRISQFSRHEKNKTINPEFKDEPWKDNGYVAWLGWGGDSAILTWSKRIIEKEMKEENSIKTNSITQNLTAKCYKTRFLEAGIVNYPEQNQMVYISPENLPTIAEKFKGCKIVIEHKEVSEQEAQQEIVGYVNNIYMEDGWAWANFTIHSQEAIEAIDNKGYSTSCAYQAVMKKQGGVKNAVEYEDEVIDIVKDDTITHIALVENPRYNDAIILENSINNKIKNKIMNIFKFKSEKEGSKELTLENSLFEIDGEEMPVSEMVSYYKNAMAEKKANKCKYANGDDKIDVDGEEMTISELANFYKKNKKKNEEMKEEDKKENEEKEEDKKENEDKEEDKKENEDMKEEDKKENEDKEEDKKENEKEEEEKKGNTMKNSIGVEKGDDLNANGIKYENGISNPCKPKVASIAAMLERGQNMFSK
jgi:hypothetical protein